MARQKGKGLGRFLKRFGKKHAKKIGSIRTQRAKEIGRAEARKPANLTLQSLGGQRDGIFRGHTRQRGKKKSPGGGFIGKLAPLALHILGGLGG